MAGHGLTGQPGRLFPVRRRLEIFLALTLVFILLITSIVSLTDSFWGPDWNSLAQCVVLGLILGWGMAVFKQRWYVFALTIIILGLIYISFVPGGMAAPVGGIWSGLISTITHGSSAGGNSGFNPEPLKQAVQAFSSDFVSFVGQVRSWVLAFSQDSSAYDPFSIGLFWDALVWLIAGWAGWAIVKWKNALLAGFPAFMLSVGSLASARRTSFVLYATLGVLFTLAAIVNIERRKQIWDETDIAYPIHKGRQIAYPALAIILGLVIASAILSSLSISRIRDLVNQQTTSNGQSGRNNQGTVVPMAPASPNQTIQANGEPRDHIIAGGPSNSDRVVMTVSVANYESLAQNENFPTLYWRSATYDVYTGHGWTTSPTQSSTYQADQPIRSDHSPFNISVQENVYPVENLEGSVYAAGEPVTTNFPSQALWRSPEDLFGMQIDRAAAYQVFSLVPDPDISSLRNAGQDYPDWVKKDFLTLPTGISSRVRNLAIQLTASQTDPLDKAIALENYLRTFPYTLDVPFPPKNQDLVDYFLFNLKKGFCDYYSTSMVVMAREVGIPARLAVGYTTGTYNLNSNRFVVTEADAHSWVEVYFPGFGWIPFEPTASSPLFNRGKTGNVAEPAISNLPARNDSVPILLISSFNGYLFLAVLGAAILLFLAYISAKQFYFLRLSGPEQASRVVGLIRGWNARLGLPTDIGATPFEMATILKNGVRNLTYAHNYPTSIQKLDEAVQFLTAELVLILYRPSNQEEKDLYHRWRILNRELRWILLSKTFFDLNDWVRDRIKSAWFEKSGKSRLN